MSSKQIMSEVNDLENLSNFLRVPTPLNWLNHAKGNLPMLLIDHAHCERKAAATAISFMSKYPEKSEIISVMSPLAREELLHFEKVLELLKEKQIRFVSLPPSGYAQQLHKQITKKGGMERLRDQLIVGAIIEARSCERFNALVSILEDKKLVKFYKSLVKSEARHFKEYLRLAHLYGHGIEEQLVKFLDVENQLIEGKDKIFRFHSGIPQGNGC